eukprot:gnl/TRDRNA2_/TRDRNA2_38600_c0_seq1.p1 gnl/TRDRNA2_/TRDRNA2_38600_c0~~gnl/TRDRNA2_/TRDRNA2_38600_c0_seq1.p1  ORF type:complete len:642 (+),score=88.38 gnl/TRDRNA2_/TRDRNA2_38600_c0_seq1:62-1927(+)
MSDVAMVADTAPKRQVSLCFTGIKFSVKESSQLKSIVRGVSGSVAGGEMLCILGPSGCGKTSLINIISKRISDSSSHQVSGSVHFGGQPLTAAKFQRIAGLVTQEDVFNASLTVQETLIFAARLRLSPALRTQRVQDVMELLQLTGCAGTKVGDPSRADTKGISGGQMRRLAIAVEILDPNISLLVLDEPTSGLDAASAMNVVKLLRNLADEGITVIATLHQPRNAILAQFHQLMVLSAGRRVFYGPMGEYQTYLDNTMQCSVPSHESPTDFLLDILNPTLSVGSSADVGILSTAGLDVSETLADLYEASALRKVMDENEDVIHARADVQQNEGSAAVGHQTWLSQFFVLLHRTVIIKMRDPAVMATQMTTALICGLLFGGIYLDVYNADKLPHLALLDAQMVTTMTTLMAMFMPFDVVLTFPTERCIFLRERGAGLYYTSAFFLSRILADMPLHIAAASLQAFVVYPMANLKMALSAWVALNVLAVLVGACIFQLVGSASSSFETGNMLATVVMVVLMILSNTFTRQPPSWMHWVRDISPLDLLVQTAMYFEFRDLGEGGQVFGTSEEIWDAAGLQVRTDDEMWMSLCTLLMTLLVCRVVTFLNVKFLYTGQTFHHNLWQ